MVDEIGRLGRRAGGEIKSLLHLHRVAPELFRQSLEFFEADDTAAPHGDELTRLDHIASDDGFPASYVTISDFALIGKVSRRLLAHETSAMARRAGRFAVYVAMAAPTAPGLRPRAGTPDATRSI